MRWRWLGVTFAAVCYLCVHVMFFAPERMVPQSQPAARAPVPAAPFVSSDAVASAQPADEDEAGADEEASAAEDSDAARAELQEWFTRHSIRIPAGNDLSQESLIQALVPVWGTSKPRVMIDLGSHPAFGDIQQYNDALIFMEYFHSAGAGGAVLAADAVPDFAEDVRQRMLEMAPYSAMSAVKRLSVAAWVGNTDTFEHGAPNKTARFVRQMGYCLAGHSFDRLVKYCALERAGRPESMCRVTRRRLGITCAPGTSGAQPLPAIGYKAALRQPVELQQRTVESLWRRELGGVHIDLLKIDIDVGWHLYSAGMAAILKERAVSLMVIEVDRNWRQLADGRGARPAEVVEEFVSTCARHDYIVYLKVPCAIAVLRSCRPKPLREGRCTYNAPRNRTVGVEKLLRLPAGAAGRLPLALKLQQDLLVVDSRQPELVATFDKLTPPCPGPYFGQQAMPQAAGAPQ